MKKYIQAYTLIEVLVVIAIVGIVTVAAVPFLRSVQLNTGLTTTTNDLVAAFQYARSTSIRLQDRAVVCSSNTATSATPTCGGGAVAWNEGWIIFHDADNSGDFDGGVVDTLLSVSGRPAFPGLIIQVENAANIAGYVSFSAPAGEPMDRTGANQIGTFKICMSNDTEHARAVKLNASGRVASTRDINCP